MENLEYFLLDQSHFSLDNGDFPLKEKSVFKMKGLQAKNIRDLAEKAKDYARRIIVKIANHPDEYNQLTTQDKLGRGYMMSAMRGIIAGDCFALSDFSLKEFHALKSCLENTIVNKKEWKTEGIENLLQQIFHQEGDEFYRQINFSQKELRLINTILLENNLDNLSDKILDKKLININLESNDQVNFITKRIDTAVKYSVGNCTEIACIAMEYIAKHDDQVSAELFRIVGGDHVFLVVNRDPKSDPHDPLTWGDQAYICDPWANKVYPAKDYLKELKNFQNLIFKTQLERFNLKKHQVSPLKGLNADLLRNAYSKAHLTELIEAFNQKLEQFAKAFEQLKKHGIFKMVKVNHFDQKVHGIIVDIKKNSILNCHDYIEKHREKGYMAFKNELEEKLSQFQTLHSKYSNFLQQLAAKNSQPKQEKKSLFFSEENSEEFYSKAVTGYPTMFSPF